MSSQVDELYFRWLYGQVGSVREKNPSKTYWKLLNQFYTTQYFYFVPNDHNRAEDGRDLRHRFIHYSGVSPDDEWMGLGCSFLELLLGLAHRLAFETRESPKAWFWKLVENLGLEELTDANWGELTHEAVFEVLNQVNERTYAPDGTGGLFPLEHPEHDQREIEVWYQLCAYLLDN